MDVTINNICNFPISSNGHKPHSDNIQNEGNHSQSDKDAEHKQQVRLISDIDIGCNFKTSTNTPPSTNKLSVIIPDGTIIDIKVHNILCNYTLPMHIDLRLIAYHSINVDYDRFKGVLIKQLRDPDCTVKIFNSGKVVIIRCKSELECMRAARQIGRMIQRGMNKLDQRICIRKYRVSNIFATCRLPFAVRVEEVARKYRGEGAKYEPELMSGLEWVLEEPKSFLRIHTTGSITISGATSELNLVKSIERVYPFLKEFSYQKCAEAEINPDYDPQFISSSNDSNSRRRPRQQIKTFGGSSIEKDQGILPPKRGRYGDRKVGEVIGTGIYNNQIYWEDEDDVFAEDECFPEDDDCLYDEDD